MQKTLRNILVVLMNRQNSGVGHAERRTESSSIETALQGIFKSSSTEDMDTVSDRRPVAIGGAAYPIALSFVPTISTELSCPISSSSVLKSELPHCSSTSLPLSTSANIVETRRTQPDGTRGYRVLSDVSQHLNEIEVARSTYQTAGAARRRRKTLGGGELEC